jgi:hypothetical protein
VVTEMLQLGPFDQNKKERKYHIKEGAFIDGF